MPLPIRTRHRPRMTALSAVRRQIQKLSPYLSLTLLIGPVLLVEPLKVFAVCVAGEGHWLIGMGMLLGAYAVSLLVVERIFRAVKPKLLTLKWFKDIWTWLAALRSKVLPRRNVSVESR
jgi:hypothetical protein